MKRNSYEGVYINLIILSIVLIFTTPFGIAYKSSAETITITVSDKERIVTGTGDNLSSKFLVYTTNEVFENTDSWLFWKFDSADVQNTLQPGETYTVTVAGWRIQFLSMYRNIVEVE